MCPLNLGVALASLEVLAHPKDGVASELIYQRVAERGPGETEGPLWSGWLR